MPMTNSAAPVAEVTTKPTQSQQEDADLIILGGGYTGACLALMACSSALDLKRVVVVDALPLKIEQPPQPSFDARSTALSYSSVSLFKQMGVWQDLLPVLEPIKKVYVSRQQGYHRVVMDHDEHDLPALGYVGENQQLGRILMAAIKKESRIQWFGGYEVQKLKPVAHGYQIEMRENLTASHSTLEKSTLEKSPIGSLVLKTPMLVVAAGTKNPLIEGLGIDYHCEAYGQHAIISTVEISRPHQGVCP